MDNIINLLKDKLEPLSNIHGVDGIVLGGSECINLANKDSDIDICIYYNNEINWLTVNSIISSIDDCQRTNILPAPYYWGTNLNSGGVFLLDGYEIDLCIRETTVIEHVIHECINGNIRVSYQAGYPFGFCNTYFVAEINYCKIVYDKFGIVNQLKEFVMKNWISISNHLQIAYLNESAYQWVCIRKANNDNKLYNQSEINSCIFSLLNVYACHANILFFHNKHAISRLTKVMNDCRIFRHLNEIMLLMNGNSTQEMLRLLGDLILEELPFIVKRQSYIDIKCFNTIKLFLMKQRE